MNSPAEAMLIDERIKRMKASDGVVKPVSDNDGAVDEIPF